MKGTAPEELHIIAICIIAAGVLAHGFIYFMQTNSLIYM